MSDERLRLFVALELGKRVRSALVAWRESVADVVPGLRAVAPDSLHVTLCFLGWRNPEDVEPIAGACRSVLGAPAPRLTLADPLWLPPRRPRALAVRLDDPDGTLSDVQSALARALEAGGWYAPELRQFLAHVTIARVARGARVPAVSLPPAPPLRFTASQITLYRSRLKPSGAEYEPLATVTLGG